MLVRTLLKEVLKKVVNNKINHADPSHKTENIIRVQRGKNIPLSISQ